MLTDGFDLFVWLLFKLMLVLAVVALIFAATAREDAYRAADKQTKKFWVILLAAAVAVGLIENFVAPMMFLILAATVASIVFLVGVRPALKAVSGGGKRRGGSSSDGPYGPYNGGR
ncbi:DUF2516 family protein [Streptomyces sp. NBC_00102]|uniref:DUF2516 family protein n=1 Tax=Streptomyces sp. NBC_00102 TaxID=2975652 RepID=UPI00224F0256|nr:DUF2516 family protein [Streptomyces sp. NBC_00102]MCX5397954.1 DUF2516 family protein [Streptomyces sp. NBC_00102]